MGITLRKLMKILDKNEPWTVGTEDGQGWIFYYDGKSLYNGSRHGLTLDDFLERECVELYNREERKHWSDEDKNRYMELEAGKAFIVTGNESGTI